MASAAVPASGSRPADSSSAPAAVDSSTDVLKNKVVRNVAIALVVTFPFLKILYATGDSAVTGEVLRLHGPSGWMGIVIDNILRYPALFLVLFVLVSGSVSLLGFVGAAARKVTGRGNKPSPVKSRLVVVAAAITTPLLGFLWALSLFGLAWAVATAVATALFRLPSDLHHARFRDHETERTETRVDRWLMTAGRTMLHVLALVVLPLAALYTVFDGEAWESVRNCSVGSVTQGDHDARVVEIKRGGRGIGTGWEVGTVNIVSGTDCVDSPYKVRSALWE